MNGMRHYQTANRTSECHFRKGVPLPVMSALLACLVGDNGVDDNLTAIHAHTASNLFEMNFRVNDFEQIFNLRLSI